MPGRSGSRASPRGDGRARRRRLLRGDRLRAKPGQGVPARVEREAGDRAHRTRRAGPRFPYPHCRLRRRRAARPPLERRSRAQGLRRSRAFARRSRRARPWPPPARYPAGERPRRSATSRTSTPAGRRRAGRRRSTSSNARLCRPSWSIVRGSTDEPGTGLPWPPPSPSSAPSSGPGFASRRRLPSDGPAPRRSSWRACRRDRCAASSR